MNTYIAESVVMNTLVDHLYDAESVEVAEAIAESQGWTFLGIPVDVDLTSFEMH